VRWTSSLKINTVCILWVPNLKYISIYIYIYTYMCKHMNKYVTLCNMITYLTCNYLHMISYNQIFQIRIRAFLCHVSGNGHFGVSS
jgi:Ca2+/H+ antiporter